MRISATDWAEGGWDVDQSVVLARRLQDLGVDLIDVSSGGLVPKARIPVGKGYQVPFARRIRDEAGIADRGGRADHRAAPRRRDRHRRRRRPGLPRPRAAPRAVLGAQGPARAGRGAGVADAVRLRRQAAGEVTVWLESRAMRTSSCSGRIPPRCSPITFRPSRKIFSN